MHCICAVMFYWDIHTRMTDATQKVAVHTFSSDISVRSSMSLPDCSVSDAIIEFVAMITFS